MASRSSSARPPTPAQASQLDKDMRPVLLLAILATLCAIYMLLNAGRVVRFLLSSTSSQGWRLRNPSSLPKSRAITRAFHPSRLEIHFRGVYNKTLQRPIPFFRYTVGQVLVGLILLASISVILIWDFDYRKDGKRSAHLAVCLLPLQILLASKNSLLSILGKSYEKLNFLHRFLGRLIILLAAFHAGLMLYATHKFHLLNFSQTRYQTGLIRISSLTIIWFSSTRLVRRFAYLLFMFCHILGYMTFMVAVCFHVPYARPWIVTAASLLLIDYLLRATRTRYRRATISSPPGGGLTKLEVPNCTGWRAGQHVRIRILRSRQALSSHPFTIARTSQENGNKLILCIKPVGTWTRSLKSIKEAEPLSRASFGTEEKHDVQGECFDRAERVYTVPVLIQGPYGASLNVMTDFETLVFVAGGSGESTPLPKLVYTYKVAYHSKLSLSIKRIKFVWIVKHPSSADAFSSVLDHLVQEASYVFLPVSVQINLSQYTGHAIGFSGCEIRSGRPDLFQILDRMTNITIGKGEERGKGVYVAVCGPNSLIRSSRAAVAQLSRAKSTKAGSVVLHTEAFGW